MATALPLFGPIPGGPEMLVILLIAVLLFGANKIPKLARSTGTAIGEFRKGRKEVEQELQEMEDAVDPTTDMTDSTANDSVDREDEPESSGSSTDPDQSPIASDSQASTETEEIETETVDN